MLTTRFELKRRSDGRTDCDARQENFAGTSDSVDACGDCDSKSRYVVASPIDVTDMDSDADNEIMLGQCGTKFFSGVQRAGT